MKTWLLAHREAILATLVAMHYLPGGDSPWVKVLLDGLSNAILNAT